MGGGWDGLIGNKANLSPAKLKLAYIGLELSLAKFFKYPVRGGGMILVHFHGFGEEY